MFRRPLAYGRSVAVCFLERCKAVSRRAVLHQLFRDRCDRSGSRGLGQGSFYVSVQALSLRHLEEVPFGNGTAVLSCTSFFQPWLHDDCFGEAVALWWWPFHFSCLVV
jgi:hypothetical protein